MTISYPLLLLAGGLTGVAASNCPLAGGGLSPRNNADFLGQFYVDDTDVFTTTDFGTPVDDTHSLKAGERGPTLLEDFVLRTKITRFDHERVPERAGSYFGLSFRLVELTSFQYTLVVPLRTDTSSRMLTIQI